MFGIVLSQSRISDDFDIKHTANMLGGLDDACHACVRCLVTPTGAVGLCGTNTQSK